jgi:hypothetical protein
MRKSFVLAVILIALLTACGPGRNLEVTTPNSTIRLTTPGPNPELDKPDDQGNVAGIVTGLWHGIIAPIMLIGSFFNPAMQIYEVHNNGLEYNLGFLVGVAVIFLLLGLFGGRRR